MFIIGLLFEKSRFDMTFRKNLDFNQFYRKSRLKSKSLRNLDFGQTFRKLSITVIIFEKFRFSYQLSKKIPIILILVKIFEKCRL